MQSSIYLSIIVYDLLYLKSNVTFLKFYAWSVVIDEQFQRIPGLAF